MSVRILVDVSQRDVAGLHGVVVALDEQLPHRRTEIAGAEADRAAQLALVRQVVLIDVRRLEIGIDALVAESGRRALGPGGEAVLQYRPIVGDEIPEGIARHDVARALRGARWMEDAEAAADNVLRVAPGAIGEAQSRADVVEVGVDQPGPQSRLVRGQRPVQGLRARRQQARNLRTRDDMVAAVVRQEIREDVVAIDEHADHFVTRAEKQRRVRVHLPIVLEEQGVVVRRRVHRLVAARVALLAHQIRETEQKIGKGVARGKPGKVIAPLRLVRAG